jgi:repressor LexA
MSAESDLQLEKRLTSSQRQVLNHLRAREAKGRAPPCLDELCLELGLTSRGSLHKHIRALVDAGFVADLGGKQRGVRLAQGAPAPRAVAVPLLGRIAAGMPMDGVASFERIFVPPELLGRGDTYALRVRGESMNDAGILDGDVVLVEKRSSARNGEIVVALIDREETTLKRIEQLPGQILLHPENARFKTQRYRPEQVEIQGVLVGLMRRY